jgi:acyl dehydratase
MGARVIATAEELKGLLGQQLGVTDWLTVDQERVDGFAKVTGDHQWIHVDTERAEQSPFGGTIAHGFLTLALTVPFGAELYELGFGRSRLNYGINTVRFPAPVPVGSRIRAQVTLDGIRDPGDRSGPSADHDVHHRERGQGTPGLRGRAAHPRHPLSRGTTP